jgi:uncharacterized protein YcbX
VRLKEVELDEKGFKEDRRFMVVYPVPLPIWKQKFEKADCTHRFLTQRQCPSLAKVVATIDSDCLSLTCGNKAIRISLQPPTPPTTFRAGIWDDQIQVDDMGDDVADFLQSIVNSDSECKAGDEGADVSYVSYQSVRLVAHTLSDRRATQKFTPPAARSWILGESPLVALTDGFPILIACQASLDFLNERLEKNGKQSLPMGRFRPNIVIHGTTAFEEDRWKVIAIGDQMFSVVKACPRCKQSCTDQETGKVSAEPLETMKTFRALGRKSEDVFFAQNAIPLNQGNIREGDPVRVLQRGDPVYC